MKGEVVVVKVVPGDTVEAGQVVAVISAMKMEMAVQSSVSGVVRATHVGVGRLDGAEDASELTGLRIDLRDRQAHGADTVDVALVVVLLELLVIVQVLTLMSLTILWL